MVLANTPALSLLLPLCSPARWAGVSMSLSLVVCRDAANTRLLSSDRLNIITKVRKTMALVYACVARQNTILSEHAQGSPNASSIAQLVLSKVDSTQPQKLTYLYEQHLIHYVVSPPLVFLCIASESLGRRLPFTFLLQTQHDFEERFPDVVELPPYGAASYNKELPGNMARAERGESDPGKQVQTEITQVKDIMVQNIERVLERGERIDTLVDKTDRMNQTAFAFRKRSTALKRQMWWKNVKLMVLLAFVIVFVIYLFVGFGCGLPSWQKCVRGHT